MSDTVTPTGRESAGPESSHEGVTTPPDQPGHSVVSQPADGDDEPEVFPREYVEQLRGENAKYRQRAQAADTLAQRLHTELVRATGRLADPTDLEFDADHIEDSDKLSLAIDELLDAKPHLATRRPTGDIGQGNRGPSSGDFSLLGMLKERT